MATLEELAQDPRFRFPGALEGMEFTPRPRESQISAAPEPGGSLGGELLKLLGGGEDWIQRQRASGQEGMPLAALEAMLSQVTGAAQIPGMVLGSNTARGVLGNELAAKLGGMTGATTAQRYARDVEGQIPIASLLLGMAPIGGPKNPRGLLSAAERTKLMTQRARLQDKIDNLAFGHPQRRALEDEYDALDELLSPRPEMTTPFGGQYRSVGGTTGGRTQEEVVRNARRDVQTPETSRAVSHAAERAEALDGGAQRRLITEIQNQTQANERFRGAIGRRFDHWGPIDGEYIQRTLSNDPRAEPLATQLDETIGLLRDAPNGSPYQLEILQEQGDIYRELDALLLAREGGLGQYARGIRANQSPEHIAADERIRLQNATHHNREEIARNRTEQNRVMDDMDRAHEREFSGDEGTYEEELAQYREDLERQLRDLEAEELDLYNQPPPEADGEDLTTVTQAMVEGNRNPISDPQTLLESLTGGSDDVINTGYDIYAGQGVRPHVPMRQLRAEELSEASRVEDLPEDVIAQIDNSIGDIRGLSEAQLNTHLEGARSRVEVPENASTQERYEALRAQRVVHHVENELVTRGAGEVGDPLSPVETVHNPRSFAGENAGEAGDADAVHDTLLDTLMGRGPRRENTAGRANELDTLNSERAEVIARLNQTGLNPEEDRELLERFNRIEERFRELGAVPES